MNFGKGALGLSLCPYGHYMLLLGFWDYAKRSLLLFSLGEFFVVGYRDDGRDWKVFAGEDDVLAHDPHLSVDDTDPGLQLRQRHLIFLWLVGCTHI